MEQEKIKTVDLIEGQGWQMILFLSSYVCGVEDVLVTQLCLTPCDPQGLQPTRQEYWSGLPFLPPGDLHNPGIQPESPALAGRFFTHCDTWGGTEVLVSLLSSILRILILFATFLVLFTVLELLSSTFLVFCLDAILLQTYTNVQLLKVFYH